VLWITLLGNLLMRYVAARKTEKPSGPLLGLIMMSH
jgi:hypothetical protein